MVYTIKPRSDVYCLFVCLFIFFFSVFVIQPLFNAFVGLLFFFLSAGKAFSLASKKVDVFQTSSSRWRG